MPTIAAYLLTALLRLPRLFNVLCEMCAGQDIRFALCARGYTNNIIHKYTPAYSKAAYTIVVVI